ELRSQRTDCCRYYRRGHRWWPDSRSTILARACVDIDSPADIQAAFAVETIMFEWRDLFQWDRFITPSIIKVFYWLAIVLSALYGLSGVFSGLAMMALNPFAGFVLVLASLAGVMVGIVFSRVAA